MDSLDTYLSCVRGMLPDLDAFLNPGADGDAVAGLETEFGVELPASYKELLRRHDGEARHLILFGAGFATLETVRRETEYLRQNTGEMAPETNLQPERVRGDLFLKGRIPFTDSGSGNFLCFDYAPGPEGKAGQIITVALGDPDPMCVVADSFDQFLATLVRLAGERRYILHDNRSELEDGDEDWAEVYFDVPEGWSRLSQSLYK